MFLVLLLLSLLIRAYSAPISDVNSITLDHPTPCTCPDLTGRTTWSIVWSCMTTVFLCTWVAVHPNIPPHKATRTAIFVRRFKIMLWAMVAPELIIFWAMRQWFGARQIVEMFKGAAYNWTRMQAQFAQMGGFVLFENNEPVRVVPPEELLLLSQDNKIDFPKISEKEIEDRSKDDPLSKVLVITQTSWFIIQFIARVAGRMAVTEIEVVTLALAMLNGVMYFLWWNKPLDVRCAIPVHLKSIDATTICEDLSEGDVTDQGGLENNINGADGLQEQDLWFAETDNLNLALQVPSSETCTNRPSWKTKLSRFLHPLVKFLSSVTTMVQTCFALGVDSRFHKRSYLALMTPINQMVEHSTVDPGDTLFYSFPDHEHYMLMFMHTSVLGTFTGAIHCIMWISPFPSLVEEVLWRTATALVTAYPFLVFLWLVFLIIAPNIATDLGGGKAWLTLKVAGTYIGLLGLVGRLSLLVQALVSLRDIPAAAFEIDNWSNMIPHL